MIKKLSLLLALGLGCIALAWGLFRLHGIFLDERDDALAAISTQRRALEQYAARDLAERLASRVEASKTRIDAAVDDPLLPARDLLLVDAGEEVLPRGGVAAVEKSDGEAIRILADYGWPRGGPARMLAEYAARRGDGDSPWQERLGLLAALEAALDRRDRPAIEDGVRSILAHRSLYVIDARRDIPLALGMLQQLAHQADPDERFMRRALRDGFELGGARIDGLERDLLRHRGRMSQDELVALAGAIRELALRYGVPCGDFAERLHEPSAPRVELPEPLVGPMLLDGGWYVAPAGGGRVYGMTVDVAAAVDEVAAAMRQRRLVPEDAFVAGQAFDRAVEARELGVAIDLSEWAPAIRAIEARYRLKALLEVAIAALSFGVLALGAMVMRRRQRFVELKSDFVSAVSHELRTPLASIRLMAETLERRTQSVPGVRDYPSRILRDIDGLSFLVENILSFNRLSRGRWTPRLGEVRLGDVAAELDGERDAWARRPAELASDLDEVVLRADRELLKLLFTNLLRNACQYCEREPAAIALAAERQGGSWLVRVRDNGVGVPEAERERIFEDFHRGQHGERGSGLGLAICRKIMEAHGGTIRVADSGPDGTTFELSFPAARS